MLLENLVISAVMVVMVVLCVTVHALGLSGMITVLQSERARSLRDGASTGGDPGLFSLCSGCWACMPWR